ncbi:nuclear transport factor 2 family protein [Pseudarthrobacter sp. fls2-241-R2A-168]|uniref:nuclear transport factor 2 family protein n=1 Tax=Pseudarthrobacter sp. fls2-241-R2A-168 TaxID=3040304 RepID=UPI0033065EB2
MVSTKRQEAGAPANLDDLLAVEAIKQLKGNYFRYLDTKHWEAWRQLFTDDLRTDGTFFRTRRTTSS